MNVWKIVLFPVFMYIYVVYIFRGILVSTISTSGDINSIFLSLIYLSGISATLVSRIIPVRPNIGYGIAADILAYSANYGFTVIMLNYLLRLTLVQSLENVYLFETQVLPLLVINIILPYILIAIIVKQEIRKQKQQVIQGGVKNVRLA